MAKGLEISKKVQLYGYNNEDLREFNQENINKLSVPSGKFNAFASPVGVW